MERVHCSRKYWCCTHLKVSIGKQVSKEFKYLGAVLAGVPILSTGLKPCIKNESTPVTDFITHICSHHSLTFLWFICEGHLICGLNVFVCLMFILNVFHKNNLIYGCISLTNFKTVTLEKQFAQFLFIFSLPESGIMWRYEQLHDFD